MRIILLTGGLLALWNCAAVAQLPWVPDRQMSLEVDLYEIGGSQQAHLERAEAFLADQQWDEAIDTFRRLISRDGHQLIAVDSPTNDRPDQHFIPLRDYGHMRLAELSRRHPEAIELYRRRMDPLAERWYHEAVETNDAARLDRLIREMFVSRYGDRALLIRGTLAMRDGDHAKARHCWQSIHGDFLVSPEAAAATGLPEGLPLYLVFRDQDFDKRWDELEPLLHNPEFENRLIYPDSPIPQAEVRARLVLVSIMEGAVQRAGIELEILRRWDGDASGSIGGREGRYVQLLEELLSRSKEWAAPPAGPWTTFAGQPGRNGVYAEHLELIGSPLWTADLIPLASTDSSAGTLSGPRDPDPGYFPVVQDGMVYVNELTRLRAFQLESGEPWPPGAEAALYDTRLSQNVVFDFDPETMGAVRSTLTAGKDRLFARLASPITGFSQFDATRPDERGFLAGLNLQAEGRLLPGFPIRLTGQPWQRWAIDGTPVADDSAIYVVLRRRDNVSVQLHVACFDLQTGQLRWRSPPLCTADTPAAADTDEITHTLLSRRHGLLYVNTNLGAIAAVRVEDGQIAWLMRYPRLPWPSRDPDRSDQHYQRTLNPCLVEGDLVFAAPADSDRLFALDSMTGHMRWTTSAGRAVDVRHLLGVGQGNLIASGERLYWLDAATGRPVGQFPPPDEPLGPETPRGFGRGVLAGDAVYWPTQTAIYVFDQTTQRTPRGWQPAGKDVFELASRGAEGGNLIPAGSVLLIATNDTLYAFAGAEEATEVPVSLTARQKDVDPGYQQIVDAPHVSAPSRLEREDSIPAAASRTIQAR